MSKKLRLTTEVKKTDTTLGLILGWGIICKENGEEYFDVQGDHISENLMLTSVTEFMKSSNVVRDMHIKDDGGLLPGTVLFSFPLTDEIAKAYSIECPTRGWLVGVMPDDKEVLKKFESGEYTGFSIGGMGSYA